MVKVHKNYLKQICLAASSMPGVGGQWHHLLAGVSVMVAGVGGGGGREEGGRVLAPVIIKAQGTHLPETRPYDAWGIRIVLMWMRVTPRSKLPTSLAALSWKESPP